MKDDSGSYTRKNHGFRCKTTRLCRTSSRRSISLHSSKNGRFSKIVKIQTQNVQTYGYVFHDKNRPNLGGPLMIQWFFLNEICMATHLHCICGKNNLRKVYWNWDGKVPNWECPFVHRKQGLFLSAYVDDIKMAGKKKNLSPMCKKLMKRTSSYAQSVTQTHIFLMSRAYDRSSNAHAFGSRHVDCLVPGATQKSFVHLMFHGTLLESQFSSPSLFSSFLSTPFPTSTPNPMSTPSLLSPSTSQNQSQRNSARRHAVWPSGQTKPSCRM